MKKFILIPFLFLASLSYAQSIDVTKITQPDLVSLIGSIASYESFGGRQLHLGIFKTSNRSGSANIPETDEISFNILLSVAPYDENPVHKLVTTGPFIYPKIIEKRDSGDSIVIVIDHFTKSKVKRSEIIVKESDVKLQLNPK